MSSTFSRALGADLRRFVTSSGDGDAKPTVESDVLSYAVGSVAVPKPERLPKTSTDLVPCVV